MEGRGPGDGGASIDRPSQPEDSLRRQLDIEKLIAVERAAVQVVEPVARLWHEVATAAERILTPHSLDSVIRDALTTMGRLLSVNTVALLLANEPGDELMARAAIGLSEELTIGLGIRAGQGMAGRVLKDRAPLVVGDLSSIDVVNPVLRHSGLRSVAAVPLLSGGHALGVLYAASYEEDRFTLADADLLQMVADRLAAALDRVRLFEKERDARRHAEQLAGRIARLQRATQELASARTTEEVAGALVRSLDAGTMPWCGVWLLGENHLVPSAHSAMPPPGWEGPLALDAADVMVVPILGEDVAAGAVVMIDDARLLTTDERELLVAIVHQAEQAFERVRLAAAERAAAQRATFYARAAQILAEADDLLDTLGRLGDLAVGALGEICLIDLVGEEGDIRRMVARHRDPGCQPLVDRLRTEFPPDPRGAQPAVLAIMTGRATWSEEMPDEWLRSTTVSEEHFALLRALGFRSYLTVPLVSAQRVVGSVTCVSTTRPFQRDDMAFAEELARHVGAVVDNAHRYESAFRTSQILQASLLPSSLPSVPGVRVETRYLTANRGLEVGGDFYDVLTMPSGHVLFVVGDVAGHDRGAAAQMGHLRSAFRALSSHASSPAELVTSIRSAWGILGLDRTATAVVGYLDPGSGSLRAVAAGHYPPLLISAGGGPGAAAYLPLVPGPPFGIEAPPASEWRGTLASGQVLLGYTDGLIDERGAGSTASMERLAVVAARGHVDPVAVCDRIVAAITHTRADDVALMALSRAAAS